MPNWSSDFVKTNGIRIHYHRTGGDKPPLLLVHSITDASMCWVRLVQVLKQEYDVIMLDARGHGYSDAPETGYSAQDHAADLAGLIETLGLKKPTLIGHSMGASNVARLAAEYSYLVGRIILEDPPWRSDAIETVQERQARLAKWQQQIVKIQSKTREEIIAFGRQKNPTWDEIEYGPWADAKKLVNPNVFEFIATERCWEESIPKIACPTLLITANPDQGAVLTPEVAKQIVETNSNIRVVHIKGAGHNIRREQPQAYLEEVKNFLPETSEGQLVRKQIESKADGFIDRRLPTRVRWGVLN